MQLPKRLLTTFGATAALTALGACGSGSATPACSHVASPRGSDRARGTGGAPFRTAQRLVNALRPGQIGCLQAGTYAGDVVFRHGGRRWRPITLRGIRGRATIVGRLWISHAANFVHITSLRLDGINPTRLPSPTVDSIGDSFFADDVTNEHTAICFDLGSSEGWGRAVATLIARSRIHGCGQLPPTNRNHGIYVANSVRARILDNQIYDNADRGIQLYANAQWTTVTGNIIDHNGEGVTISGDGQTASSNNLIADNIISDSTVRADVESWWPSGAVRGHGNVVKGNCISGRIGIDASGGGFVSRDNTFGTPSFVDGARNDYRLAPGSRCVRVMAAAATAATAAGPAARRSTAALGIVASG